MNSLDIKNNKEQGQKGFSIIELTFVIVIVGTVISMIVFTTQARLDVARIFTTKERLEIIIDAIERYAETYGHLPCPAQIDATKDDLDYGWATGSAGSGVGDCSQATLVHEDASGNSGDLVKGMVPIRSLIPPLDAQMAVDGWGNRFTYFLSENFSVIDNYGGTGSNTLGIIRVYNNADTGSGFVGSGTSGHAYALLSHGPNGHGAYKDRSPSSAIDLDGDETSNDTENADDDDAFTQSMPLAQYYDDILITRFRWQLPDLLN